MYPNKPEKKNVPNTQITASSRSEDRKIGRGGLALSKSVRGVKRPHHDRSIIIPKIITVKTAIEANA